MPVPSLLTDLSTTAASNSPSGSDNVFPDLDNYIRALSAIVASIGTNSATNGFAQPYLPAANPTYTGTLTGGTGVVNLGSGQFYKDASGNVGIGIGTTAPAARLELSTTSAGATAEILRLSNPGAGGNTQAQIKFFTTSTNYGTISGGYGAAVPQMTFDLPSATAGNYVWQISSTERMRLDASGNLLVGTTTASAKLCVSGVAATGLTARFDSTNNTTTPVFQLITSDTTGDSRWQQFYSDGTTLRGSIDYNRAGGLVRYNTTSDYRAKDIIGPVQNPGAAIDALKVYEGQMKGATESRPMLIAHEAQAVAPYAVTGTKDAVDADGNPVYQQIDTSSLVPLLLAELKSLRARVAALEAA